MTLIAVPYDITQISWIADELESCRHRIMLLVDTSPKAAASVRAVQYRPACWIRLEREIGALAALPKFYNSVEHVYKASFLIHRPYLQFSAAQEQHGLRYQP